MTREILVYPVNGYKNNKIIESNTVIDTNKRVLSLERYIANYLGVGGAKPA